MTMSSREIAQLINKEHSNIKISAERLAEKGIISTLAMQWFEHNGNRYTEYMLNKRDSLILVAQNCPEFTAAIVDRWQELENSNKPAIPQTYAAALIEAGRLAMEVEKQAEQLALQAPKVEFVDKFATRGSLQNATQVAQTMGMSAVKMNRLLDEIGGVYNKSVKRGRVFCTDFVEKGFGEMKQTDQGFPQALFTTLGVTKITEILIAEGAA